MKYLPKGLFFSFTVQFSFSVAQVVHLKVETLVWMRLNFGPDFLEIKFHISTKISSQVFNKAFFSSSFAGSLHVKHGC